MKKKEEMVPQSSHLSKNLSQVIEQLLKDKSAFILYKKPSESSINLLVQSKKGSDCFHLKYFNSTNEIIVKGIIFSENNIHKAVDLNERNSVHLLPESNEQFTSQQEFEGYVNTIIEQCKKDNIVKSVAARKKKVNLPNDFNLIHTFLKACEKYLDAFIHLSFTNFGLWLGASPELLLANNGTSFSTVSLAGTKTISELREWTAKELEEQDIVTKYIIDAIKTNNAFDIEQSKTYTVKAGHLQHLKNDIKFKARDKNSLLNALHPTPAVCGTPKDKALQLIENNEKSNRGFYAGFIGLDAPQGFYFVNLRCMQFFTDYAAIYVGAGITKDSEPNAEWMETENKAQTMQSLLNIE